MTSSLVIVSPVPPSPLVDTVFPALSKSPSKLLTSAESMLESPSPDSHPDDPALESSVLWSRADDRPVPRDRDEPRDDPDSEAGLSGMAPSPPGLTGLSPYLEPTYPGPYPSSVPDWTDEPSLDDREFPSSVAGMAYGDASGVAAAFDASTARWASFARASAPPDAADWSAVAVDPLWLVVAL